MEQSRIPTTGMRGGLGRTLLTAFLVLAIVPLSAISWYATLRERQDIQREVTAKLSSVAAVTEMQIRQWIEHRIASLAFLAALPPTRENVSLLVVNAANPSTGSEQSATTARDALRLQLQTVLLQDPAFRCLAVIDSEGKVLVSTDPQTEGLLAEQAPALESEQDSALQFIILDPTADERLMVTVRLSASRLSSTKPHDEAQRITGQDDETLGLLVGWLNPSNLVADLQAVGKLGETGEIYLVDASGMALPQGQAVTSSGIEAALAGENREGLYENYASVPVIGVYHWMPELGLALVAEQTQEEAFATTYNVTAAVVGATLVVALVTAAIAAVVTRQFTRPIVQLTESALGIAGGDLEQRVPVTSRDEIGILAYVFNHMAAELKTLYDDLEDKVAQRTALLQRANYQIQRRAIQMQASLEVGQAVTSVLDPNRLLEQVVQVVRGRFAYSYVAVYTSDEEGEYMLLRAFAGDADPFHGQQVPADLPGPVGQAFREGVAAVESRPLPITVGPPASYTRSEVALPLRLGDRTLGVLDVQITDEEGFDADDVSVLQNVANQIVIALENARAYAVEREAVERLQELDRSKRRFLSNMSHELRTPLTNIIGFSRLMLKGINGSFTERQQNDLEIIYQNGQHLLGLINDLLDISQIEAGLMELEFREVDLADLVSSVMATASALVRDKDIELRQEIAPDLPIVRADTARIRQVLLRLLANAAKFTGQGTITVRAWPAGGEVMVSVSDTGVGIPPGDRERIFQRFEQGTMDGRRPNGAGLGLALSKEFVEMHGGHIWVESDVGRGSTFTFTLPLRLAASDEEADQRQTGGNL
ncbi:MAG: ATP-binding protein [Anaerolineae bacterium]